MKGSRRSYNSDDRECVFKYFPELNRLYKTKVGKRTGHWNHRLHKITQLERNWTSGPELETTWTINELFWDSMLSLRVSLSTFLNISKDSTDRGECHPLTNDLCVCYGVMKPKKTTKCLFVFSSSLICTFVSVTGYVISKMLLLTVVNIWGLFSAPTPKQCMCVWLTHTFRIRQIHSAVQTQWLTDVSWRRRCSRMCRDTLTQDDNKHVNLK